MPKFFISYSRVDMTFAERFKVLLERQSPKCDIFLDSKSIYAGQDWWKEILDNIERCDIFFYLLSNDSVQSEYCQTEFEFARQLRKPIITVQVRDRTKLVGSLSAIQYVDMSPGKDMVEAMASLGGAIQIQLAEKKRRPLSRKRPENPTEVVTEMRSDDDDIIDTPNLIIQDNKNGRFQDILSFLERFQQLIGVIITAIVMILLAGRALDVNLLHQGVTNPQTTQVTDDQIATLEATEPTPSATLTPSVTNEANDPNLQLLITRDYFVIHVLSETSLEGLQLGVIDNSIERELRSVVDDVPLIRARDNIASAGSCIMYTYVQYPSVGAPNQCIDDIQRIVLSSDEMFWWQAGIEQQLQVGIYQDEEFLRVCDIDNYGGDCSFYYGATQ